ncbi:MAG: carboxypeptidase-like regulatory domain-containing protein [Candidatus Kapabacteria bacterium]|nr:carboxypeptidase-like regulatory domain-containing protein [Ignavibacteriota bacterium]MCW5885546.1 carboxypeptidase-like regulatory domain-containing protein [Candidatus Kapabacteria bacterium]
MKIYVLAVSFLLASLSAWSESSLIIVEGTIVDNSNGKTIPGASINVAGTNRGTYTSAKGFFRLKARQGDTLLIRSIGYASHKYIVAKENLNIEIKLKSIPVKTGDVNVTASITPEQIIERAVKKRDENIKKLRTFSGELYSKVVMELGGSLLSAGAGDDGSFSISATFGADDEVDDSKRFFIMETYSTLMKDYEKNITEAVINKRRQTANIPADNNLMAISDFISFYDDEINFLKTRIPSPVGKYAISSYNFEIAERINYDDRFIYVMNVIPNSKIYPRFEGTVHIVEGTYNIVEIDLKPTETTALPFFTGISIKQKYNESEESIWYPSFLEVEAKAKVEVLKGLLDLDADVKATSIFSDAKLNSQLPDSLYNKKMHSITVSNLADERDSLFWEKNSLRELSVRESEIYARVDSVIKLDTTDRSNDSDIHNFNKFTYSLLVSYFDFNRVGSVSLGLSPKAAYKGFSLNTTGYFSFGLQDLYGSAALKLPNIRFGSTNLSISGDVYSLQNSFGITIGQYPRFLNSIAGLLVHEDYFDFYQSDGFGFDIRLFDRNFDFNLRGDISRQFSLKKNTDKSIFENYEWRHNQAAVEGEFKTLRATFTYGKINSIMLPDKFDASINIDAFAGMQTGFDESFTGVSGLLTLVIPTFHTGYSPMNLLVGVSGGITSDNTPVQYQHRMATRLFIFNKFGNFYTTPLGFYGGDKFYAVQGLYNLSDIWWRWLGLPTYQGRGPELTIGGSYGEFYNSTNSFYRQTGNHGYAEAGFGFSRIPTFISNIVYFAFDIRFGINEHAKGRTAGAVSISLPF